jgi:outer membrane protein assembly factor BamB
LLAAVRDIKSLTGLSFDFSVNSRYPKVRTLWTYETGYTIASTPAVWKNMAIVGDASGEVYALSLKAGKAQWMFTTGNAVYSTPDSSIRTASSSTALRTIC